MARQSAAEVCKRWREKHPERQKESCRKWREKNPGKAAEMTHNWYINNRERALQATKDWQANNPEKYKQHLQNQYKKYYARIVAYNAVRRARRAGVEEHFSAKQGRCVLEQFAYRCFKCNSAEKLQIYHHMPLALGYALEFGNAVVLCYRCNAGKRIKLPEQFYTPDELARVSLLLEEQKLWSVDRSPAAKYGKIKE